MGMYVSANTNLAYLDIHIYISNYVNSLPEKMDIQSVSDLISSSGLKLSGIPLKLISMQMLIYSVWLGTVAAKEVIKACQRK